MRHDVTSPLIENIVNQYLKLDPEAIQHLASLQGKILCIEVTGLDRQYYIFPQQDKVEIRAEHEGEADTIIRGMPSALLKLAAQADSAPLMLSGEIEIIGDVRSGRAFKKCLSAMNIDWEEHLSKVVGDVPANLAFGAVSKMASWTKQAVSSFRDDLSEYLQEESRDVVSAAELNEFNNKVDQLRDDIERLAAKLKP